MLLPRVGVAPGTTSLVLSGGPLGTSLIAPPYQGGIPQGWYWPSNHWFPSYTPACPGDPVIQTILNPFGPVPNVTPFAVDESARGQCCFPGITMPPGPDVVRPPRDGNGGAPTPTSSGDASWSTAPQRAVWSTAPQRWGRNQRTGEPCCATGSDGAGSGTAWQPYGTQSQLKGYLMDTSLLGASRLSTIGLGLAALALGAALGYAYAWRGAYGLSGTRGRRDVRRRRRRRHPHGKRASRSLDGVQPYRTFADFGERLEDLRDRREFFKGAAQRVQETANEMATQGKGWNGSDRVFIADVAERLGTTTARIAGLLVVGVNQGWIKVARADLPAAMDAKKVAASEVVWPESISSAHFIRASKD